MNISKARHLFRNVGYLTAGKALGDVFTFALFVVLSRILGQEGVGQFSFAMAFAWPFNEAKKYSYREQED